MADAWDEQTLGFYEREAVAYGDRRPASRHRQLDAFLGRLKAGSAILELGCGGGQDAEVMIAAGHEVTATDGAPALAAQAALRLGRPVRVMRFDELEEVERYDAVWASACLLHVPEPALPLVLGRIWRALRPGGLFYASFKAGPGGGRDSLGRYNILVDRSGLGRAYASSGSWSGLTIEAGPGGGYDGVPRIWLACWAIKA